MKPLIHAKISVKKYGGTIEDYIEFHTFFDSSKASLPDVRHRAILHSSFGCFLAEQVYGPYMTNSDGKEIAIRDLAEEHVVQDLGWIPTVQDWLKNMPIEDWMLGPAAKKRRYVPMDEITID